ncbi:16714_t:CDS:2 [Cetraspora pellucida]|uniref:16714_t:CDS:1 n=1 Tax=Cetraspora pellucida TaxID=1433469 RepID=A0A9N9DB26_9GLOM|nr:16714_t:CDS:2 [Cetraspora pellucida]
MIDKEKRCQACNHLQKGYEFSKEQAFALISHERIERSKSQVISKKEEDVNICLVSDITLEEKTIKQTAQCIMKDKLSEKDALKRIMTLQCSEKIISTTLNSEEHSEQRENEGIDFLDHFSLESVKERLNKYDISNISDKQALADIMIMLCIRLAEIKNLSLEKNEEQAKQLLTWIQDNICSEQLKDPGKLGSIYLSTFLKKDKFIPENGTVFTSVAHRSKNASKANTYASETLQHSLDNHASSSKRYIIINM